MTMQIIIPCSFFLIRQMDENKMKEEGKFWNKIAKRYDQWIQTAFEDQYKVFRAKIGSYIQPDDIVLEIGTGTGDIAFHIAPKCKKVIGIDIAPEMISIANRKNLDAKFNNLSFQIGDVDDLSFAESTFTKIVCCNSLQTMKVPLNVIRGGKKVLKEDGEFLSITYCYGDSGFVEKLKLIKWTIKYGIPKYWSNFKQKDIAAHFINAGFEIIEEGVVWEKPVVLFLRCRKKIQEK